MNGWKVVVFIASLMLGGACGLIIPQLIPGPTGWVLTTLAALSIGIMCGAAMQEFEDD